MRAMLLLLALLLTAAPLAACSVDGDDGGPGASAAGTGTARTFAVAGFTGVALRGSDDVDVRVGPAFSVRAEGPSAELDKLKGQHPIIELIEKTRELAKLMNTYVDTLPLLADTRDRIHTTFNQDVAATGRLSSTAPNLQNIPIRTEQGRKIREAFIADGDKVLVSADYSQFELRLAAILSNDEKLINDFNGNVDIHTKTASEVYGIPMEMLL